jgi:uncharacterized protein
MLFGGKKEREIEELFKRHIDKVGEVITSMHKAAQDYCTDCAEFDQRAKEVMQGESHADDMRREIEQRLYEGAFMPIQRGDYAAMVEKVDKIANQCEAVAEFLLLTRPQLSAPDKDGLIQIVEATVTCYQCIKEMFDQFGEGQAIIDLGHKVEEQEQNVDNLYAEVVSKLFKTDIDLARKLHIKMLYDRAAAISNRIEDASDSFSLIVSKRP